MIKIKRVYEPATPEDGKRFLVDRLWPRGVKKEQLQLDGWVREVGPSDTLRKWFGHDLAKWEQFKQRYFAELEAKPQTWRPLMEAAHEGDVTLLFSAKDETHNNAAALKAFLEERLEARQ